MKRPLIILTGPTAVGKTELSIKLAKAVNGEIISSDSMQVYKFMDIGSAKIKPEEMQGVKHHMIDILEPTQDYNVVCFQTKAKQCIKEIYARNHVPILVGGTGFYIQSVLYDIDFTANEENQAIRERLEAILKEKGAEHLHELLKKVDPKSAEAIHFHNSKRVIRALEFYHLTGQCISEHNEKEHTKESAYRSCYFVLNDNRELLYQRIDKRVDAMIQEGLVEEVRKLMTMGCKKESTAMQGLGYKEMIDYLEGRSSLEEAIYLIKRDTRHFAKRQLTWFRREKDVIWVDKDKFAYDTEAMLAYMLACFTETM